MKKYTFNKSAWRMSRSDTAFNVDYLSARLRSCYEGWTVYLSNAQPTGGYHAYHAGDIWGCVGTWFSGTWYDQNAIGYINAVKAHMNNRDWEKPNF